MKKITVALKEKKYDIVIGHNIIPSIGKIINKLSLGQDAIIITNPLVKKHFGRALEKSLIKCGLTARFETIIDSETSKSSRVVFRLLDSIARYDIRKKIFIVALGGGVIGDLAGFVAAIYKRGVSYIQIPTTLLGQVDSAIGGKVGIDLNIGKNLAGAFYQPRLVLSDICALKSLSPRQIKAGLAEIIKYGIIKDAQLFSYIEKNLSKILSLNYLCLEHIVYKCSLIKSNIVKLDEKETKGVRTILNFGHTIGHAIEAAGKYKKYNHGEAISIGMVCAAEIAQALGLLNPQSCYRIEALLNKTGLPVKIKGLQLRDILNAYLHDKKFISRKNRFVLPTKIGAVSIYENISQEIIKDIVRNRMAGKKRS